MRSGSLRMSALKSRTALGSFIASRILLPKFGSTNLAAVRDDGADGRRRSDFTLMLRRYQPRTASAVVVGHPRAMWRAAICREQARASATCWWVIIVFAFVRLVAGQTIPCGKLGAAGGRCSPIPARYDRCQNQRTVASLPWWRADCPHGQIHFSQRAKNQRASANAESSRSCSARTR